MEPLYPRLGLLGGASEGGGKVSKLAALAAARKKKEGDKATTATPTTPAKTDQAKTPSAERQGPPLSLQERLSTAGKPQKPPEATSGLRALGKGARPESPATRKQSPAPAQPSRPKEQADSEPLKAQATKETENREEEKKEPKIDIRAEPSAFATTMVGEDIRPRMTEPSHLHSKDVDLMQLYGQDLAEFFDFAGPSPDDVVLDAQSSAKGLAIRRKV